MSRCIRLCKVGNHNVTPLRGMQWHIVERAADAIERARTHGRHYMAQNRGASLQIWEYRNGKKYSMVGDTFGAEVPTADDTAMVKAVEAIDFKAVAAKYIASK